MENLIEIKNVYKTYKMGKVENHALNNINLNIKNGEIVVILGPSGSGKTTLLNVISGLDKISKGKIIYDGKNISKYKDMNFNKDFNDIVNDIVMNLFTDMINNISIYIVEVPNETAPSIQGFAKPPA